jgi:hypothetical protein
MNSGSFIRTNNILWEVSKGNKNRAHDLDASPNPKN